MNAIRAARAFTGRIRVIKAEGAFHGTEDAMEVSIAPNVAQAGPQSAPYPLPHVEGLSPDVLSDVIIMPFNEPEAARRIVEANASEVACVIVEPVMGSAGMIPATKEYLQTLRDVTLEIGALLVFDEVITFRLAPGGAQEYFGILPDLTCFGKMIGGGLPLGAFGGREGVMALFDPSRGRPAIHHGGSLNANPLSMVAGAATLEQLSPEDYASLSYRGETLRTSLVEMFMQMEQPAQITGLGSLFGSTLPTSRYTTTGMRRPETANCGTRSSWECSTKA